MDVGRGINGNAPDGVSDQNGNQYCPVPPVGHDESSPTNQKHQPNIYGGQLMVAPVCSDYPCGGPLGDCQTIASLDPNSWMSAECYPSRAYDLPLTQAPMTNLSLNQINPTGPLPSHSHHQELEEPAAVCVKAERTYTPDSSRTHQHPPPTSAYEDLFPEDPTKYRSLRPHSTPATLLWLDENYEMAEGVCIPRNALYLHYVDFCAKNAMQPVNAASFGKIIRQQFPALTTRRLGTRGQSRYHYYGIAIREHSPYFEPTYSKKSGETPDMGSKRQSHSNAVVTSTLIDNGNLKTEHPLNYPPPGGRGISASSLGLGNPSQRVKLTAVLPEFPTLRALNVTSAVDREQVSSFLTMYRTHSQRILDTILAMNLDQVRVHLQHFWFGIPQHVASGLGCPVLVNLVALCDFALYKTVQGLLLPSLIQPLPESFIRMVDIFTHDYESWLERALIGFPKALQHVKIEVGKRFIYQLRRRLSVNQLSQAAKMLLLNRQLVDQMVQDWREWRGAYCAASPIGGAGRSGALLDSLSFQLVPPGISNRPSDGTTTTTGPSGSERERTACHQDTFFCVLAELESCLETSTSLETLLLWMDSVIEKYASGIYRPTAKRVKGVLRACPQSQRDVCCGFFKTWRSCSQKIFRNLTIKGTTHYASFQLLRVLFDDYVQLSLEGVLGDCLVREMQENIANNRTLEVEHIHALEMLSATSAYPQAQLEAASPKVQLTSPVTTLNVHPTAAEGHIEPPKPVQLCALPPQMPAGTALLEKTKQLRRVGATSNDSSLDLPEGYQTTHTAQTTPPVAIFYETTNCYAGVTSVIQQTTNIITTTATAATGSLYGAAEVLEAGGGDFGCAGSTQAGGQCLIISGESSSPGVHPSTVEWASPHPPSGPPSHPHYTSAAHHYRQTTAPPGGGGQTHNLHHFN